MRFIFSIAVATFRLDAVRCTRIDVGPQNHMIMENSTEDVSCGGHMARSCSECPNGNGASGCHGDCHWVGDGGDGQCRSKAELASNSSITEFGITAGLKPGRNVPQEDRYVDELPLFDEAPLDYYEKTGICCKKKDRWNEDIMRWFYFIPEGGKPQEVESCPEGWDPEKAGLFDSANKVGPCLGKEAHNLATYEENTDWVYCCKRADKEKYTFYETGRCSAREAFVSCDNWDCRVVFDTSRAKWFCPAGYSRYVNYPSTYYCNTRPPEHLSITDVDCAGFTADCAKKQCMFQSKQTSEIDCTPECKLAKEGNGTQGWYSKKEKDFGGGAGILAINFVVLLLSILSIV